MKEMELIDKLFTDLESKDDNYRYNSFKELLTITDNKVPWAYDKWYNLIEKLSSDNSYQRSIGLMLLANISKSDPENRTSTILEKYLEFFEDEKFITSRQCIQNVWKVAFPHESNRNKIIRQLENSYFTNIHLSKHGNLIKQDIISSLYNIYQNTKDKSLLIKINSLIDSEIDIKLQKSLKKIIKN